MGEVEKSVENGRYVKYAFFKINLGWRRLDDNLRAAGRKEFIEILENPPDQMTLKTYSLVGIRGDCDFLLWMITPVLEDMQSLTATLLSTKLGRYLETPYSYLAMSRRSEYLGGDNPAGGGKLSFEKEIANSKYLFVYPFTKKREWYKVPLGERRRIMSEHFKVGHKYPSVKIHTAYSFGLDDQEFMLSFETDSPTDFLELVMDLRGTDSSKYTALETPIFTCLAADPQKMLELLG